MADRALLHSTRRHITTGLRRVAAAAVVAGFAAAAGTAPAADGAVDWDNVKTHVENWIGAASVAVPAQVGALATGVSAMPSSLKGGLTLRCHENMQRITLELGDPSLDPARTRELQLLLDKNQHVLDALNGQPEGLRTFITKLQQQGGGPAPSPTRTMRDDDRDFMDSLLGRYAKRIEALRQRAQAEHRRFVELRDTGVELEEGLETLASWAETSRDAIELTEPFRAEACERYGATDRRIHAYAVAVVDDESACEMAVREAERLASDCRSRADADLIRARWDEAKRLAARTVKDVELIEREAVVRMKLLDFLAQHDPTDLAVTTRANAVVKQKQLESDRTKVAQTATSLWESYEALIGIEQEGEDLLDEIRDSRDHYVKVFPGSAPRWKALTETLVTDLVFQAPDRQQARLGWEEAARGARDQLEALLASQLTTCTPDDRTPRAIDEAVAARDAALLHLAAAEHVLARADDCGRRPAAPPTSAPAAQPAPTPTGSSIQLLPTTVPSGPALAGGLRIRGPATLVDGQAAVYLGTDGAGTRYPGGVTWNTSAEDVLLIGADGTAVAEKPGRATVVAHLDDMTAFFDVEILAVVPDLRGRSLAEALGLLRDAGLRGAAGGFSAAGSSGSKVTGQSLAPGSNAPAGTTVTLETDAGGPVQVAGPSSDDGAGFSTAGGESVSTSVAVQPLTTASGPDCAELEASFNTAVDLGDLRWAQSIVSSSGDCPFHGHAQAVYQSETDRVAAETAAADAERERDRCASLARRFEAALAGGSWQVAQSVLRAAAGCGFQDGGYTRLEQAVLTATCQQLYRQYQQHMANGVPDLARTVLQIARGRGCHVVAADIHALDQAIQQQQALAQQHQQQQEQAQIDSFNAFMSTIGSVIQMQQNQGGSTGGLAQNQLPPSGTGATIPTGGPTGDPVNAGGWTSPTAAQPPSQGGGSGGSSGSPGGTSGQGSDIDSGIRYPYDEARERGCLQWRGHWNDDGDFSTGFVSSWGQGTRDVSCGPLRGQTVTKYHDRCLGQDRCFATSY
jgi:hypothetical protein